jgi:hypothetical protein
MSQKSTWVRALGLSAVAVAVGLPSAVQGYIGCATSCNGAYCWGSNQHTSIGCTDGLPAPVYCTYYYSGNCS